MAKLTPTPHTKQDVDQKTVADLAQKTLHAEGYKNIRISWFCGVRVPLIVNEVVPGVLPMAPKPTKAILRADVKGRFVYVEGLKHTKTDNLGPFKGEGWRERMAEAIVKQVMLLADAPQPDPVIEGLEDKVVQLMRLLVSEIPLPTLEKLVERVPRQGPVYPLRESEQVSRKLAATLLASWQESGPPCRAHLEV